MRRFAPRLLPALLLGSLVLGGAGCRSARRSAWPRTGPGARMVWRCPPPPAAAIPSPVSPASTPPAPPTPAPAPRPGDPAAPRLGDEIVVCGRMFHTGTPVVLWLDPGGYDAYRPHRHFAPDEILPTDGKEVARFGSFRRGLDDALATRVRDEGWRLEDLQSVVHQVVVHYDAAGTSARCFEILQDHRGLSTHFLLDLDGRIYQTLDLKERAWHAGTSNDVSVGIEIANPGAYADEADLARWIEETPEGVAFVLPAGVRRGALPEGAVFRPSRPELVRGMVQGREHVQADFTTAQYAALEKLLATLCRVFPRVKPDAPRDETGSVHTGALDDAEQVRDFEGIVGHLHVSAAKVDPGPAFRWDEVLARVRDELGATRSR